MKTFPTFNEFKINEADQNLDHYMFFDDIKTIARICEKLSTLNPEQVDSILQNGHDWACDHVSLAKGKMQDVIGFLMNEIK